MTEVASPWVKTATKQKENIIYNKEELCKKIGEIYPDIGECGIDVDVDYDESEKIWVVNLKSGQKSLKTFLEKKGRGPAYGRKTGCVLRN